MKNQNPNSSKEWFTRSLLCVSTVAMLLASCSIPESVASLWATPTPTPTSTPTSTPTPMATATPTVTLTSTPTRTPMPTNTPTITPTRPPTATSTPDLSAATLTLKDLPLGFQTLSPAELQQIGFTESAFSQSFGTLSQARPRNFAVFLNSDPQKFELIAHLLLYPLSTLETAGLDLEISRPDAFCKSLGSGLAGSGTTVAIKSCSVLPGMDKFGDRSLGSSIVLSTSSIALRADIVAVRRGTVIEAVYAFYLDGTQPLIGVSEIARILDTRVAVALGSK